MDVLVASSSSLISSTLGFSIANMVTWAGNRALLILGGGLGLFDGLLGWLIAVAIIFAVIFFGKRLFRLYHH